MGRKGAKKATSAEGMGEGEGEGGGETLISSQEIWLQAFIISVARHAFLHNVGEETNITSESNIEVMKMKEMITNYRRSWLLIKFSSPAP